ncbi:Multidrug resistance efflux pump [Roseateles sp. YR242]|uniref:HlyD family secretion protein n=1 Tax=Roseateles sp. YR242 TaxID=1855305 RepID=UPI0008CD5918|nr:HlyD family secretion protein [Roseateles sp. YR242]SEK68117.1 Multidrug resistance efflux pump [Roseateles sp. YR242]
MTSTPPSAPGNEPAAPLPPPAHPPGYPPAPAPTSAGVALAASAAETAGANIALPTDGEGAAPPPKYLKASPTAIVLMLVVLLVGVTLILRAWEIGPFDSSLETTDNAYVRGAVTVLAPQVNGYVVEVLVKDFEDVRAGQPLVRIDDRLYVAAVALADAQRANATAQLENFAQNQAQNQATLGASRATMTSAEGELARSDAELARVEDLAQRGSVSLNERDRVRSSHRLAQANVEKARADIRIGEERVKATTVGRASLRAQVEAAEAQLAQAQINLANTVVKAPADGQVSEVSVRLGQYVTAGSQLLFLVPKQLWVVANFKETQTGHMDIGQPVHFKADALKDVRFTGRIQQIAPATGSEFSVLKADNATGNFTKVVQRLPVRIALDPDQPMASRLRPGMSVVVSVDTAASAPGAAASGASR